MATPNTSTSKIPVLYNKCAAYSGFAKFAVHKLESGGSEEVQGECSQVDHVFCGTRRDPDYASEVALLHGDLFQVYGGSINKIIISDSGEDKVTLRLTHNGTSPEILVVYGTKQKNT